MRMRAYRNPAELSGTGVVNTRAWRAPDVPPPVNQLARVEFADGAVWD